jgi:hypothetical protein
MIERSTLLNLIKTTPFAYYLMCHWLRHHLVIVSVLRALSDPDVVPDAMPYILF